MSKHGQAILKRLPESRATVAEIGVAAGELSDYLLANHELDYIMVDSWEAREPGDPYREQCAQVGDINGERSEDSVRNDHVAAIDVASRYGVRMITMDSVTAAGNVEDASLDLVFIDADHRDEATFADCEAWLGKVKPGGWIGGHDYGRFIDDGVRLAVDRFCEKNDLELELDIDWTWFAKVGGEPC